MDGTAERTWTFIDKAGWGDGPWVGEPDKVQWIDGATGLDCLAVRNHFGAWCGYVGVPEGHPWHGRNYDDRALDAIEVHGGLTFDGPCAHGDQYDLTRTEAEVIARGAKVLPGADLQEWRICHVPFEGRGEVHWFGFDCAHAGGLAPGLKPFSDHFRDDRYRDLSYARQQTADLARQLAKAEA